MDNNLESRVAELQIISKVLNTKDIRILTENGLNEDYFKYYKNELKFIQDHYEKYSVVPDIITFNKEFKTWQNVEVNESDGYLVQSLVKSKQLDDLMNKFARIKDLLLVDRVDEAFELANQKLEYSTKNYLGNVTDVFGKEASQGRLQEYNEKMQRPNNYYIKTGFPELDEAFGGGWDRKEEFATIVARPGVGKSWILLTTAYAASSAGLRVGLFSGEMSKNKVGFRLDTIASHISNASISHGKRDVQREYTAYVNDIDKVTKGPIYVATIAEDFEGRTPTIRDFETFIKKYNLDIFCLDQQSLMDDLEHSKNPIDKAGNIAKELKLLQTTCQIPLITVCQQNRTGEQAIDKNGNHKDVEYDVSRIAQSDKIGQYSTIVLFLDYDRELRVLSIHPAKVRDSGCAKVQYAWDIDKGIFSHIVVDMGEPEDSEECEELRKSFEGENNSDLVF